MYVCVCACVESFNFAISPCKVSRTKENGKKVGRGNGGRIDRESKGEREMEKKMQRTE